MKKILFITTLLILTGCTIHNYVPQVTAAPSDTVKFNSDLQYCREDATARQKAAISQNRMRAIGIGSLGVAGLAVDKAVQPAKDDFSMSPLEMIDGCMHDLGHPVIVRQRAF